MPRRYDGGLVAQRRVEQPCDLGRGKQRGDRRKSSAEQRRVDEDRRRDRAQERGFRTIDVVEPPGEERRDHRRRGERPGGEARPLPDRDIDGDRPDRSDRSKDKPPHGRPLQPVGLRQRLPVDRACDQNRDRRVERQHIVRQLRHREFEDDPARHDPGEQKPHAGLVAPSPHGAGGERREHRSRKEREPEQREIVARRAPMHFLRAAHFGEQIASERLGEERRAAARDDRDEPRQHEQQHPGEPRQGPQAQQEPRRAVERGERHDGERDEQQNQWTLDQHAGRERGPEDRRHDEGMVIVEPLAARGEIGAAERAHGGGRRREKHGVGGREPRLHAEQHRTRHHEAREHRAARRNEDEGRPVSEQDRSDRPEQRGNAIQPDARERPRHAERLARLHRSRLQPVNADRLLVATDLLEADVDIVARLDHLLGRLREARLVAVDRRDVEEARQEGEQADDREARDGVRVRLRRESEQRPEAPTGTAALR